MSKRAGASEEVSEEFIQYMRNRMEVSLHKYGPVRDGFPHKVNAIKSLETRLKKYKETGNAEYLIDVANFAMIEFMLPAHAESHFEAKDSADSPGRSWHAGGASTARPNSGER
jgi:hypothetical protein